MLSETQAVSVARLETLAGVDKCLLTHEWAGLHCEGISHTTHTAGYPKSRIVLAILARGQNEDRLPALNEKQKKNGDNENLGQGKGVLVAVKQGYVNTGCLTALR